VIRHLKELNKKNLDGKDEQKKRTTSYFKKVVISNPHNLFSPGRQMSRNA